VLVKGEEHRQDYRMTGLPLLLYALQVLLFTTAQAILSSCHPVILSELFGRATLRQDERFRMREQDERECSCRSSCSPILYFYPVEVPTEHP